jgi:pimeloyl-ACP methyl ester carboxylesterase
MEQIGSDGRDGGGERILLVALPGAYMGPRDFATAGFDWMLRHDRLPVDLVAAEIESGLYLDEAVPERIRSAIILPARGRGYRRIWLLAISLGGMGALQYLRDYPGEIEGAILIAPFLGTRGLIAEVERAGGLPLWHPEPSAPGDIERPFLLWLRAQNFLAGGSPAVYLGCGREDRFAAASTLLAACLPPERVVAVAGGHDWPTWTTLWRMILARRPFDVPLRLVP